MKLQHNTADLEALDFVKTIKARTEAISIDKEQEAYLLGLFDIEQEGWVSLRVCLHGDNRCNLACRYCFTRDQRRQDQDGVRLSEELIERTVDFFTTSGRKIRQLDLEFNLSGEPLLNFDLFKKTLRLIQQRESQSGIRMSVGFATNGLLLDDEIIDWFDRNYHWLGISMDGGRETQDSMRVLPSGRGTYDILKAKVKKVLELGWDLPPAASVVLTSKNPDLKKNFLDLWELGFRLIMTKPARATDSVYYAVNQLSLPFVSEHYLSFCNFLLQKVMQGELDYVKAILSNFDYFGRFLVRVLLGSFVPYRCGGGKYNFSVLNDGSIYPCCDSVASLRRERLGSIYQDTLETIENLDLVKRVDKLYSCQGCWVKYLCGGPCIFNTFINSGSFEGKSESDCRLIKFLVALSCYFWEYLLNSSQTEAIQTLRDFVQRQGANRPLIYDIPWLSLGIP